MTLIACFIFDIKKYQEKEHLTAAHRNEKYLSNSVCCDVARVCGGSCKIFLDFGSLVAKRNPSKTSSPGSRNEQALEAKRRPPTPSMPATPVSSIFARVAVAEWSARGARGGTCRKDGNPRPPTRPAASSYIVAMAGASDTVDATTPTRTHEVSLHSVRAC